MKDQKEKSKNKVLIYTTQYCPYCIAAKKLLRSKQVDFQEIDVTDDDTESAPQTQINQQIGQGLPVVNRPVKKRRVRARRKRLFFYA